MPRVFVDMDGVLVDFDSYKQALGLTGDEVKKKPGAYLNMKAIPEAVAGVKWLIGAGYEVWIATKPPTGIAFAYADKAEWVFQNFPELKRRLILTHDKGLLGDREDFLIDDRPHKANCEKFKGILIPFNNGETWPGVIHKIKCAAPALPTIEEMSGLVDFGTPSFPIGKCKHCGKDVPDERKDGQTIIFCSYECYCSD